MRKRNFFTHLSCRDLKLSKSKIDESKKIGVIVYKTITLQFMHKKTCQVYQMFYGTRMDVEYILDESGALETETIII